MKLIVFSLAMFLCNANWAQVTITAISPSSSNANQLFEKFELEIQLSQTQFTIPYDPATIAVSGYSTME